jgi:hypothetical protein
MGLIGSPPARYWKHDDILLPKEGLPTTKYTSQTRFEQICRYFYINPPVPSTVAEAASLHHRVDRVLDHIKKAAQSYWI